MRTLARTLEIVDGNAVGSGDADCLTGPARGFAIGGPAQDEVGGRIELRPQHLEHVPGVQGLDERIESGESAVSYTHLTLPTSDLV